MQYTPSPENQARLDQLAAQTGWSAEVLLNKALTDYFNGLAEVRQTLNDRYDDIESGRVALIDGEEARARLRAKHRAM